MRKFLMFVLCAALLAALFAGCGPGKQAELALVTDSGTVEDGSFNQGAWEGLVKYAEEKGLAYAHYEPESEETQAYLAAVEAAVEQGARVVVMPGALFEEAVETAQAMYPEVDFIAVDCVLKTPASNAVGITYAEEQAGFLAGYALVKEGMTRLGFLGGRAVPGVIRYGYGFAQGAERAAQELGLGEGSIELRYTYTDSFEANPQAQAQAAGWYADGTQVIFAAGGGVGESVMAAAEAAGAKVVGVDVDQSAASDTIVTSAVKSLGNSVYDMIAQSEAGAFPGGQNLLLDASSGGVALAMDNARFLTYTQADYAAIFAMMETNTGNIASSIVRDTDAQGQAVEPGALPLAAVALLFEG